MTESGQPIMKLCDHGVHEVCGSYARTLLQFNTSSEIFFDFT